MTIEIIPSARIKGKVRSLYAALGEDFVSEQVDKLSLSYSGIKGDLHAGLTREAGAREPWYKAGVEMRNERQISLVSSEELDEIAKDMDIDAVDAGWIGANIVVEGVPQFTFVPGRSIMIFEGGVSIRIDGFNAPCNYAGAEIARYTGVEAENLLTTKRAHQFTRAAKMKRGLVGWVEREGEIKPGEEFTIRIWEQWIYPAK